MFAPLYLGSAALALGSALLIINPAYVAQEAINCEGCVGGAFSGSNSNSATCPGAVLAISVAVADGMCEGEVNYPPGGEQCIAGPCHAVVTRSWAGLPANSTINICHEYGGVKRCINPPPNSGPSGSGSDTKQYDISCSATSWTWILESPGCGFQATASGGCSECEEG